MDILCSNSSDSNPTKFCRGCNRDLPATLHYFSPQKENKNGLTSRCKECLANTSAAYRKNNPEKAKEGRKRYQASDAAKQSKARYRATHRDHIKAEKDKWHAEHREEQRLYSMQYNATHHEERLDYGRRRHEARRDELNERNRQYRKTEHSRNIHRIHENNRRARKVSIPGVLTDEQIQQKLTAQKHKCYYCFKKFEKKDGKYIYHLEHTVPISRTEAAPRHDINYVVLACSPCNLRKNNRLLHEWPEGGRLL